jgi:hypothetical protein
MALDCSDFGANQRVAYSQIVHILNKHFWIFAMDAFDAWMMF